MTNIRLPSTKDIYDALRARNPWLPPGDYVVGNTGIDLNIGLNKLPTVRLELFVEVPDFVVDGTHYEFYGALLSEPEETTTEDQQELPFEHEDT